jgi:integrase
MFRRRGGKTYYWRRQVDGERKWINLGADLAEACRLRKEFMRSGVVIGSQVPVRKLASQWLDSYVRTMRSPDNHRKAAARVRMYLIPFLGEKPIARVSKENLRAYRVWLEERPISLQTVKHILSDARCFFRWAEDTGYVGRSPFPKRLQPKLQEKPPDRLTEAEIATLVKLPEPYGFVIRFALATGLRWAECAFRRS